MQQVASLGPFRPRALSPIAWSLLLSLIIHAVLITAIEFGNRFDFWRVSPIAWLAEFLGVEPPRPAEAKPAAVEPAVPEVREIPMVFVDVDPSQATLEDPPDTPFYSPFNSVAADADPVDDQPQPRMDGKQDKVLKTLDTQRSAAVPLQPSQPQERPAGAEAIERPPEVAERITPDPAPADKPLARLEPIERPLPRPAPGNFEAAPPPKATPVAQPAATVAPSGTGINQRERPRTLAAARAADNVNPHSALVGEKFRQEGGVKRFSVQSSLNVKGSPFGNYDARFVAIVQQCWNELLEQQRYTFDRVGKVVLRFKLTFDGRIRDMETIESNVGEIFTLLCQMAVTKPAPYDKWPTEMRKMIREDFREVMFTFYY